MHTVRRRAVLVVPASDDHKARKALTSLADEVVLDLEDAVIPANKVAARDAARCLIAEFGGSRPVAVRINGLETEWASGDLDACATMGSTLASVIVPKTESAAELVQADRLLGDSPARLQALVETAVGIRDISAICAATARLDAVVVGYADLGADLGRASGAPGAVWHFIQESVLIAGRAAGIMVVDGPRLTITDDEDFRSEKRWVRDLGFDGTWVLHPAQIGSAAEIFTPDPGAVADARRVLEALETATGRGHGATKLDGRMLDEALAASARRLLAKADTP